MPAACKDASTPGRGVGDVREHAIDMDRRDERAHVGTPSDAGLHDHCTSPPHECSGEPLIRLLMHVDALHRDAELT